MESKEVYIFSYINTKKIIRMDDFEIHPYFAYDFNSELSIDEKSLLDDFVYSFRKTFFKKGELPEVTNGIGILKYKGTIFRTKENSGDIAEKIKILFLLLKLHVSYDFFNPGMNQIDTKSFDIFGFNLSNHLTNKFGNMSECVSLYTTVPEHIRGLDYVKFYPLKFCINPIPVVFKLFGGADDIFGINPKIIDLTILYQSISKDMEYYKRFLSITAVYYGLEYQKDLFFYFSIIPSVLEVLLQLNSSDIKKQKAIEYGKMLDSKLIKINDIIETITYIHSKKGEVREKLGLIARTFSNIYDIRNDFLHEGKRSFDKLKINFRGVDLNLYDIFQLIFKYSILNDFIEKRIIEDDFSKLEFEGNVWTTGNIKIMSIKSELVMDGELDALVQKAESDKEHGI